VNDEIVREGGCACGKARYRASAEPMMVHNCHCRQCQQQTGSTSVVNAFWESDRVELLLGTLHEFAVPGGSGAPHTIARCEECGTALFSYYGRLGRLMTAIRVGSLDNPASVKPNVTIFTEEAMPWVCFSEEIPRFPKYYDAREVLPPESLERLRVLGERRKAGEG